MEPKKNPKKDLGRKSVLFFQIGLIIMLFITWRAIEWKTYDKDDLGQQVVQFDQLDEEETVVMQPNTPPPPPPPPPPPAPEVIEVVEDDEEVEEQVIESTEVTEEPQPVEVEEVQEVEEEPIADVPFTAIEDVPIFPGCEQFSSNDKRRACMSSKIKDFVNKKFNTDLGAELGLSGVNRVYVKFKIDAKGKVVGVQARAPHPRLQREAERVVKMLPDMTPGKQRGKAVGVLYSLPIVFQVQ
ncbi:energy transducer TonB [Haloflavibacter putidus]|uniref:Energy transducer TonB n=1 Tax=Haloflavibacter putidus TaxID=2576776 RepID=A0A507ZSX2_9FLAO|nr:energy transducer TonB [Haloflavibacter putidus]TQD39623.1 energy transducer TonB [Haloflavibacter putidus]